MADSDFDWDEDKRAAEARIRDVTLPYRRRGGLIVRGSILLSQSATWPFASIRIEPGLATIRMLGSEAYEFRPGPSVRLENDYGGIKFTDDDDIRGLDVVFLTSDRLVVEAALRKAGFNFD